MSFFKLSNTYPQFGLKAFNTKTAGIVNLVCNILLFLVKIVVGVMFFNLALISDAINSFLDVINAIAIMVTVKINDEPADYDHNFGHTRAESIAGYTTAILMFVLGFNIVKEAISEILNNSNPSVFNPIQFVPVVVVLIVKTSLWLYIKKIISTENSPALEANLQDHKNDLLIILGVCLSVGFTAFGFGWADAIISVLIATYIMISGYYIAKENIDHLMGKSANDKIKDKIHKIITKFPQIIYLNKLKSQYLGNKIQVEVFIKIDENISMTQAHQLSHSVQDAIENLKDVIHCGIHLDLD